MAKFALKVRIYRLHIEVVISLTFLIYKHQLGVMNRTLTKGKPPYFLRLKINSFVGTSLEFSY